MQVGMVADIAILDPETVTDNATYLQGTLPTTGIPYVIVNGTVVVSDSEVLPDVFPGQPIRFPVEAEGRFEPLTLEAWEDRYMVAPTGFHGLTDYPGKQSSLSTPQKQKTASAAKPAAEETASAKRRKDWFAKSASINIPAEADAVFCPVHRAWESPSTVLADMRNGSGGQSWPRVTAAAADAPIGMR